MDNKDLNEVTPNNEIKNMEPKVEESVKVVSENVPQVENAEIAYLEPEVEVKAEEVTSIEGTQKTTEVPVNVEVQSVEMVPSENANNVEKKIEETTEDKPREVRIINNEIELIIDEPKKEEEKVEEVVAPVEGKRLLPFIKNDDLFLLISAIILVVVGLNLDKIHSFFSNNTYKLPTDYDNPVVEEPEIDKPVGDNNEYILICTKKNNELDYVFDYVYTLNYKGVANQMIYEVKPIDFSLIEDLEEQNRKKIRFNELMNNEFNYLDNALLVGGSHLEVNDDQSFIQTMDLTIVNKKEVNKVKEVMFFNIDDSFESIKTKFINKGYECK